MELPKGYKTLKVERVCQSGFMWGFEFLNYPNVTENKKKLHYLEEHLKNLQKNTAHETTFEENQFVAVVMPSLRRVVRAYTLLRIQDIKGSTFEVFLIDYGSTEKVNARDLRKLPNYANVEKLPAQSWRIGIYGVFPLGIQLEFGETPSKTAGESWNLKDIQFIENILKDSDTIDFHEINRFQEYKFGYIYLKDPNTQRITTLQKLLVENGYAVEDEKKFNKAIPSIVKRFKRSLDHVPFPTGEQLDKSDSIDSSHILSDNESVISIDVTESEFKTPEVTETSSSKSKSAEIAALASPKLPSSNSALPSKPRVGKGRGEIFKKLQIVKPPPFQPSAMIGRLPITASDQFDDSIESIYYDTVSTSKGDSSRRESASSIEFSTPRNSSPQISRRQSSSSVEIVTPKIDQSKIETVSLITPPSSSPTNSHKVINNNVQTIDLTTPPTISLVTPSSSPSCVVNLDDSNFGSSSQFGSFTKRGRGRGELLASLSSQSNNSDSVRSATSCDESSTESLTQLKLETTPPTKARGRGALISRILNLPSCSNSKISVDSITESARTIKPTTIDFSKDIVSLNSTPKGPNNEAEISDKDELELSDQLAAVYENMLSQQEEFEDRLITKIMVLGNEGKFRFKPGVSIKDFDLHPDIKDRASQLRLFDLIRSQKYMIPAMLTRRNVTLVGPSRGGKTVASLLALFSLLKDKPFYKALPVGPGPRAVILCPYSSQCEEIERQCLALNKSSSSASSTILSEKSTLKLNVAYGCGKDAEKDKLNELTQGYDIVICTPSCLLRLLQTPEMMNFKRLCHLILEDADILFSSYRNEVDEIIQTAYSCAKKCENGLVLPQRVIISKEIVPATKKWIQEDVTHQRGFFLIASYFEAAIFSNITAVLRRIDDEERKRKDLLNYLLNEAPEKSTVIVFNEVEEMNETYNWLRSKCPRPLKKVGYSLGSADDIVADWKRSSYNGEFPIMCCTDSTLHDLNIHEANSLIHYNLPVEERGYFTERFSVLLFKLAGPSDYYTPGKMPLTFSKTDTLIYIGPNDHRQFPTIINLMEKLRMIIPEELKITANELLQARELEKDSNKFCENYKKFGRCMNEKLCQSRHYLSKKYDQPASDIPTRGFVKMQILQVYSASHLCVRLLEHRDGTKKWNKIKAAMHPGVLNAKINQYFSDRSNRSMHLCKKVGEVAAIETTTDMFKRVEILQLNMDPRNEELKSVKVKFIDDGKIEDDVRATVLVKLPEQFSTIPATTVEIFLCNVLPVDRDIDWGDIISMKVREKIKTMMESEDVIFIGEIQLVCGRDVWINPLQCHKIYDQGKDVIVIMSSMCKDLLKRKVAVDNPEHLPKLLSLYREAGLPELAEIETEPVPVIPDVQNETIIEPNSNECVSPSSRPSSPIDEVSEEPFVESVNKSNSSKSTVIYAESKQPLNQNENNVVDETYESEEEWKLEDVPQTPAAPVRHRKDDDSDSEYDLYDYETDAMPNEGLDDEFDCFFKEDDLNKLIEKMYPQFKDVKQTLDRETPSKAITMPSITDKPVIDQKSNSRGTNQPRIKKEPEDTTKYIYKPNVEWYQDTEFVNMNILLNVEDYVIRFSPDRIYFRATYDNRTYEFDEALYTVIDDSKSKHYKSTVTLTIKMEKVIKRNKWPRILKSKNKPWWIKKSIEHLDEDVQIPDMCWNLQLNPGLALKEPEIPKDFSYIGNYDSTKVPIYPDGYEDLERDSDEDSDGLGNDDQDD